MEPKKVIPTEFEKFSNLVDSVLSVPKTEVHRIRSEPWTEEKKDRMLGYLRSDLEREERSKSQVSESTPPKISEERRLQDLRYLREELEAEERRNSQIVPRK